MENAICAGRGGLLFGEIAAARILRQHDRADAALLWQYDPQQYASASVRTAARRLLYLARVARSTRLALDFVVGTDVGRGISCFLRQEGLGDICVLGFADPNSAVRDIWAVPTELSSAISISAVLQPNCRRRVEGGGILQSRYAILDA